MCNNWFVFPLDRLPVMLSLHRWQSNSHQFRRYDLVCNNVIFKHHFSISYLHHLFMTCQLASYEKKKVFPPLINEVMTYDQGPCLPSVNYSRCMLNSKEIINIDMSTPLFSVHYGTLKLDNRPPHLVATLVMWWVYLYLQTTSLLCQELVMLQQRY